MASAGRQKVDYVYEYGYEEPSAFALGLQRLGALRRRERILRSALWVWAVGTIVWMLPMGGWSAVNLPPRQLGAAGIALALIGGGLMLAYRSLHRVKVFDPSMVDRGVLPLDGFAAPRSPLSAAQSAAGETRIARRR